jgi:hypothetical protein
MLLRSFGCWTELQAGDAVQMMYLGNNGGHAVEVGSDQLDWSIINSSNVLINQAGMPTAQFVITEAVPELSGLLLASLAGTLVAAYGWRRNTKAC